MLGAFKKLGFKYHEGDKSYPPGTLLLTYATSSYIALSVESGFVSRATMTIYYQEMDQYSRSIPDFLSVLAPRSQDHILSWMSQATHLHSGTVTGLVDGYALELEHFDLDTMGRGASLTIWRAE